MEDFIMKFLNKFQEENNRGIYEAKIWKNFRCKKSLRKFQKKKSDIFKNRKFSG